MACIVVVDFCFFKQKTAYEMRISDWSSDVCSSDLKLDQTGKNPKLPKIDETLVPPMKIAKPQGWNGETPTVPAGFTITAVATDLKIPRQILVLPNGDILVAEGSGGHAPKLRPKAVIRSEEPTSELQSLMRISSAFFCLKNKK